MTTPLLCDILLNVGGHKAQPQKTKPLWNGAERGKKMLQNIINSLIEAIGFAVIVIGIPAGITLLFAKWVHSDNKGGQKNDK